MEAVGIIGVVLGILLLGAVWSATGALLSTRRGRRNHEIRSEEAQELLAAIEKHGEAMAAEIGEQLRTIHYLVNSNLTKALRAELDATVREIAMMREVIELNKKAGRQPSAEAEQAVAATETRIRELRADLEDRLHATEAGQLGSGG